MSGLRVAIIGCGLIGAKRAAALAPDDELLACYDVNERAAQGLSERYGARACASVEELLASHPDVVLVATVHDQLAGLTERALQAGAHVLVEKPAGVSTAQIDRLIECQRASGQLVKVGFNHRFHPGIARAAAEVHGVRRRLDDDDLHVAHCGPEAGAGFGIDHVLIVTKKSNATISAQMATLSGPS